MKPQLFYKYVIPLLIIALPFIVFAQYTDTDLGHDGFIGAVKSAKITTYGVEIRGGQITRGASSTYQIRSYSNSGKLEKVSDYNADGTVKRIVEYTFDKNGDILEQNDQMGAVVIKRDKYNYDKSGNLVEKITYNGDGYVERKVINYYDKKNLLIESSMYSTSFDELVLDETKKYKYDENGNKIKESFFSPEGESWGGTELKYNHIGKVIESLDLSEIGEVEVRQTFVYNKENILISRKAFEKDGKLKTEIIYDHMGQPLTFIGYDEEGHVSRKSGNRYDKFGNRTAEISFGSDDMESLDVEYKYTYDDKNNWIQQIAFQGGHAVYIIGREILFY